MNTPFSPLTITLTPRRPALVAGFENQIDVLVRIQAPAAPECFDKKRPPYGIGLVIDRSGSMSGQPLEEAKRCAAHVVQALSPEDTVALVWHWPSSRLTPAATPICTAAGWPVPSNLPRPPSRLA